MLSVTTGISIKLWWLIGSPLVAGLFSVASKAPLVCVVCICKAYTFTLGQSRVSATIDPAQAAAAAEV